MALHRKCHALLTGKNILELCAMHFKCHDQGRGMRFEVSDVLVYSIGSFLRSKGYSIRRKPELPLFDSL